MHGEDRLTIKLPFDLKKQLRLACVEQNETMSDRVIKLIQQYVDSQQRGKRGAK